MAQIAVVVLAAGKGTRMKSALPKVMHKIAGRSLLGHVLTAANGLSPARTVVVAGPDMPELAQEARDFCPNSEITVQETRAGTGHAVLQAKAALGDFSGTILILYGDCPLIQTATLAEMVASIDMDRIDKGNKAAVLGFEAAIPTGYGRLICNDQSQVVAIREELDASPQEKLIRLCNSGIISIEAERLWHLLAQVKNDNAKQEYYLTDIIELLASEGQAAALVTCPESEVAGVNDRLQLAELEAVFQNNYRQQAMRNGATLIDPASVYFAADTRLGQDVVIEPNVFFGTGVTIADHVLIRANCHIEGAKIGEGSKIGPFARIRPRTRLAADVHIGNFVEIKNATLDKGAKANHLSYIGDATVGTATNIGAGTITCNYDGYDKHKTVIGARVFIGSNTALVAPVTVADGAMVAAGSTITSDVPADALALERSSQTIHEGWAGRYRQLKSARKKARSQQ